MVTKGKVFAADRPTDLQKQMDDFFDLSHPVSFRSLTQTEVQTPSGGSRITAILIYEK